MSDASDDESRPFQDENPEFTTSSELRAKVKENFDFLANLEKSLWDVFGKPSSVDTIPSVVPEGILIS